MITKVPPPAVGTLTAQSNVTWTVNTNGISVDARGYAGTGTTFAGTNVSATATLNSAGLNLALSASAGNNGQLSAGGNTASLGTVVFSNSNGVSFGLNGQTLTASHNGLTTARASTDAVGLNTALTAGPLAWTVNSSGLSLNAGSAAGTTSGFTGNQISGSMTHNTAGLAVSLNHPAWLTTAMASNAATISNVNLSAGTTSTNASAFTFANANGVSFGLGTGASAGSITASHNALTSQSNQAFSAGGGSSAFQTLGFSDQNGVSFTNTNGSVGVTHALQHTSNTSAITSNALHSSASRVMGVVAATNNTGGGTATLTGSVSYSNANGATFYTSAGNAVALSYTVPTVPAQLSVGQSTGGNTSGDTGLATGRLVLAGGNNITLSGSTNGGSMTLTISGANVGGAQTGISGVQVSDATFTSGTVTFRNANGISFGSSGANGVSASYTVPTLTSWTVSDAATSATVGRLAFTNANGLTLSLSTSNNGNHTVVGSYTVPTVPAQFSGGVSNGGNTSGDTGFVTGRLAIVGGNNVTVSGSTNGGSMTLTISGANVGGAQTGISGVVVSDATYTSGTVSFSNANGISFGSSAGQAITASYTVPSTAGLLSAVNVSAGTTSNNLSAVTFSNANGVSFGLNGSVVTATVATNYLTTARASNDAIGLNTAKTNVTWTVNSSGLSLDAGGYAGIGLTTTTTAGTAVVGTQNTAGLSLGVPAFLTTAMASNAATISNIRVSAGTTSNLLSAVTFADGNGVSFGLNASTVTASHNGLTSQSNQNVTAGNGGFAFQTLSFSNANGVSFGTSAGSAITASHNALTTARASTDAVGLATAQSNVTWTVNSAGLSLDARGYAGTGTSNTGAASFTLNSNGLQFNGTSLAGVGTTFNGTNVSGTMTLNTAGLRLDLSAGAGGGFSAGVSNVGNTSGDTGISGTRLVLAGINNITLSQSTNASGATVSISGATVAGQPVNFSAGTTSGNLGSVVFSNSNLISFGLNGSTITGSVPATSSLSATGAFSISTNGSTISMGVGPLSVYAAGSTTGTSSGTADLRSLSLRAGAGMEAAASAGGWNVAQEMQSYYRFPDNWNGMVTGASAITQTSGSSIWVQPFRLPYPVSASYLRLLASFNDNAQGTAGTTSANTTFSCECYTTIAVVLYTQGTGANSASLQSVTSSSGGITGRTIYSAGAQGSQYTVTIQKTYPATGGVNNQYTTSYAVSSGSIVISSASNTLFTGPRFLDIPFGVSLPPGPCWIGVGASTSSASNSSNISFCGANAMALSLAGVSQSNVSVGILGSVTSASANQLARGLGVWTTNARNVSTGSIGMNSVSQVVSNPQLIFELIREA